LLRNGAVSIRAFPVLATDDERWEVRAAIDVDDDDAYGLSRDQYAHVLSTFSHKTYPRAPRALPGEVRRAEAGRPGRVHPAVRPQPGHPAQLEPAPASDRTADGRRIRD